MPAIGQVAESRRGGHGFGAAGDGEAALSPLTSADGAVRGIRQQGGRQVG
ncbi:MAG: hypothetical protein ABW215_03145 [Kibdelosporangium sp.]